MLPSWITETIKDAEGKKMYGKITLHVENGEVTRINVEQSIRKPKESLTSKPRMVK